VVYRAILAFLVVLSARMRGVGLPELKELGLKHKIEGLSITDFPSEGALFFSGSGNRSSKEKNTGWGFF
jgi:hypothetical protein